MIITHFNLLYAQIIAQRGLEGVTYALINLHVEEKSKAIHLVLSKVISMYMILD